MRKIWDAIRNTGLPSRRDLFAKLPLASLPVFLQPQSIAAAPGKGLEVGPNIYQSIGVRPLINCRGTLTIIGGSLELPEVLAAQQAAAKHYVQLDELMEGIGRRLAELTGAEWGIVTSGCAAGMAHATAACVAGGNPDLHVRIPNLHGFVKDEVIIPKHSRNVYDAAIRSVGVKIIEVNSPEELERAMGPRVAMIYIFANERSASGSLSTEAIASMAKPRGIPIFVDAAAEVLTIPNVHLQKGATLVGYSGGKALRGPQCTGIVLGRKDLVQAMWMHSAPHHGYGRSMKVGKEEAMGALMAVEMWTKRDHQAEWKQWLSRLDHIAEAVKRLDGVKTNLREPRGLSNRSPGLGISWNTAKLGITGEQVSELLYKGEPRIALGGGGARMRTADTDTGISVTAYMMQPGDEKIVAKRIVEVLSSSRGPLQQAAPKQPAADLTGRWNVHLEFLSGSTDHVLYLNQQGNQIVGTHHGDFVKRDLAGTIDGPSVRVTSNMSEGEMGDHLTFTFAGTLEAGEMSGEVDMGEYLKAKWTAKRHTYSRTL